MDSKPVKQLKPIDYLKVIFRRKWLIIVPVFIGVVGGIIAGNTLPKIYQSSTLILVEEGKVINPLIQGIAVSTSVAQRLSMLREQILGWDRLMQLIKTLQLDKDVKNQYEFEALVKKLRKRIMVGLRNQNLITISYEGNDPAETQKIVKTTTDIFIAENVRQQGREAENAIDFINDQVKLYQKKLKQSEIAAMQEQLKKLLVDSTEKHPMVMELNKKIAAAQKELDAGDYSVDSATLSASGPDNAALKAQIKKLKDDLATQTVDATDAAPGTNRSKLSGVSNDKLYKLLLLDKLDKSEARDEGVTQKLYNELLSRLETAKITQRLEASKEGTRYTILDPARLPLKPAKPNKLIVLFVGLFLGASAGLGLVFLAELFDHSFLGIDEAKAFLEFPVFGAVSKIITQEDLKLQKLQNARITMISAVTGVVLLIVVIFNVFLGN
ncbi:MAG: GNVR domain-containing protein [Candidatus Omnitrophota bacterium]|nr:GNVR domain-containing protein [Candidatus Omnitrophota bacterium]